MSISITGVCNIALVKIGVDPISDINDPTNKPSRTCLALWEGNRDAVLEATKWKCASKRAELTQLEDAPLFDWDYQYQLPADYIRMIAAKDNIPYLIEGDKLLSDEEEVFIRYVYRLTTTGSYHPTLIEAMAARLASELAIPLKASPALRASMFQEFQLILTTAEVINAFDDQLDEQVQKQDSWHVARRS